MRPRSRGSKPRKTSSEGMDLGTRALVLGIGSLLFSWVPLLNIVAFLAALMAVAFGLIARWPAGGMMAGGEPNERRGLWGVVLGAIALVVFVVTAVRYSVI